MNVISAFSERILFVKPVVADFFDLVGHIFFKTETTSNMLMRMRYAGNAISENVHLWVTRKLVIGLKTPTKNGQLNSLSGFRQAFLKVGDAARASLIIAKTMATLGFSVIYHNTNARLDKAPQA